MDILSILLLAVIAVAVVLAIRHMKKHPTCSGNCTGCTMECKKRMK